MNATAYRDMIHLSRPISRHPKMSVENRAKLFTPFSALRGFDIEILTQEQDRLLVPQVSLSADQQEAIYRTLNELKKGDWVTVTYFAPVKILEGRQLGEYRTLSGEVKKVDDVEQVLVTTQGGAPFGCLWRCAREGETPPAPKAPWRGGPGPLAWGEGRS